MPLTTADTVKIETLAAFATAIMVDVDCFSRARAPGLDFGRALLILQR